MLVQMEQNSCCNTSVSIDFHGAAQVRLNSHGVILSSQLQVCSRLKACGQTAGSELWL